MTWVVGGNCFNGFVCVADIQATIIKSNGQTHYYNCVQKIHKVTDNFCVAFSGDIRSGFKIVDFLRENIAYNFKEGEYFDIDGQSQDLINILKYAYNDANPRNKHNVELMFLWNSTSIARHSRVPSSIILSVLKRLPQYKLSCTKSKAH